MRDGRLFLLWGLERRWLDGVLSAAVVVGLAWSRFALLASGPWEWDETLFARGMLHFELAAHFPHPPGFPGWLAIGHLLRPLAGDPLGALQLASALASVVAIVPLSALGRRLAPPAVATSAGLVVLMAPGPWLHAVRGFSSTTAAVFALAAAAVASGGRERWRPTAFTLLVTAAFLVRPILLPPLAVLWVVGAVAMRPLRRLLPGVVAALASVAGAAWAMAAAEGGWGAFARPFTVHAGRHFSRLAGNPGGWFDLGLVKGFGGGLLGTALVATALAGLAALGRDHGRRKARAWALVLGVAVVQLLFLQNRTYSRYATPVQMASAPLIASCASLVPAPVACGALLTLAALGGIRSHPVVSEQHRTTLAAWSAVESAADLARERGMSVIVEPELHPFASYRWHLDGGDRPAAEPPLRLSPWAPEPWQGVAGPYLVATCHRHLYLEPLVGGEVVFGGVSNELYPLTQQRLLEAWIIANPPLPLAHWWPAEVTAAGERFMWGSADAALALPPLPAGTALAFDLAPAPGPAPLAVVVNGRRAAELEGRAGRSVVWIEPEHVRQRVGQEVVLARSEAYPAGGHDARQLAVQLFAVRAVGPAVAWGGPVASKRQRDLLGIDGSGLHGVEVFGAAGQGCWTQGHARLEVPAGEGTLRLVVLSARPRSAATVVRVAGRDAVGPLDLGQEPVQVELELAPRGEPVVVELQSVPYVPAEEGLGNDRRELGVVLLEIYFEPVPEVMRKWRLTLD